MGYPDNLAVLVDETVNVATLPKVSADAFADLVRDRGMLSSVKSFLGYFFDAEHRISRDFQHQEVAKVLVENGVCEDVPSALSDISQVVGNHINGVYGSYRWNEKVNPATGEKWLYMSYISYSASDPI